jgi:chromodomain-helicase-DNA-binding protein 4
MATFIGLLKQQYDAWPALVVVPNSTLTNWMREFARWAPELRVVPYHGESAARKIMEEYELFHDSPAPKTIGIKYHVLVTTYETVTAPGNLTAIFKKVPRWEVMVIDEGQRRGSSFTMHYYRC